MTEFHRTSVSKEGDDVKEKGNKYAWCQIKRIHSVRAFRKLLQIFIETENILHGSFKVFFLNWISAFERKETPGSVHDDYLGKLFHNLFVLFDNEDSYKFEWKCFCYIGKIAQPQNMLDAKSRFYNNFKTLEGNEFLIKRSNHINVAKIYYNFILNARYTEDNKYCAINLATFSTAHSDCRKTVTVSLEKWTSIV